MENSNLYFERGTEIIQTKGNLPHWSQTAKLYAVTFRLRDSLPEHVLEAYKSYKDWCEQMLQLHGYVPEQLVDFEIDERKRVMEYLDAGHGECLLRNPKVREILIRCLAYMDGRDCSVHCYVIMPNHVHLILETNGGLKVSDLVGRLKGVSANQINKLLERKGSVWQYEIYDRLIRNEKHYWNAVRYIANNPRKCPIGTFTLMLSEEQRKHLGI